MLYRALKTAAGRLNFSAGELVELEAADAKELLRVGAVQKAKEDDEPETDSATADATDSD